MGSQIGKLKSKFTSDKRTPRRILMIGLKNSGKTTILYRLKHGQIVTDLPQASVGFNAESIVHGGVTLNILDVDI